MMDQELKAKWIAALRSGKYKQDQGIYRSKQGFCCLGVLADCINPDTWIWDTEKDGYVGRHPEVKKVLTEHDGMWLVNMNDGTGDFYRNRKSFLEIADWIEANL